MKADIGTRAASPSLAAVEKSPTGINGLDEVTYGGVPKGGPTLLCGSAGCGKILIRRILVWSHKRHRPG